MKRNPPSADKTARFREITQQYAALMAKVCYIFAGPGAAFDDLYQETLINLWTGMDSFRGDAAITSWLYRTAINTCISWHRRNDKHSMRTSVDASDAFGLSDPGSDVSEQAEELEELRILHRMISDLPPLDKAIITLWLDERSYDEISAVTGLSRNNIAVRIHRIKALLVEKGKNL